MPPHDLRRREIQRVRRQLEADDFPRLKMTLIVGLTGVGGFIASYLMLKAGLLAMAGRYPLAVGVAYLVFLFLLWLWLRNEAEDPEIDSLPDFGDGSARQAPADGLPPETGDAATGFGDDGGGGLGDVADAVAGADEFAAPLVVLLFVAALVLATGWIVYSAPLLFAELLVDGVLAASLYRRLRGLETRHWLETAIRRTFWAFALTAVTLAVAGAFMHGLAPEAHTFGEFLRADS